MVSLKYANALWNFCCFPINVLSQLSLIEFKTEFLHRITKLSFTKSQKTVHICQLLLAALMFAQCEKILKKGVNR